MLRIMVKNNLSFLWFDDSDMKDIFHLAYPTLKVLYN
jgi:hypothetical protein